MQNKQKKPQLPHVAQQKETIVVYQQMKINLLQILQSLMQEKQSWEKQQRKRTQLLLTDISDRQHAIRQLIAQNQQLKQQLETATRQLQEKTGNIESLKRKNQLLQSSKLRTDNIIAYLESKNKEINYELFEAKKLTMLKSRKQTRLRTSNSNFPDYILNKIDYPSIFDYTGVLDQQASVEQLHKSQSSPNLQLINPSTAHTHIPSATSSCLPKTLQNNSSSHSRSVSIKKGLKDKVPQPTTANVSCKQENPQIKGSLKKIKTLGHLFDTDNKKKTKDMRKGKRFNLEWDLETDQKQALNIKSRVGTKKCDTTKKVK